MSEKPHVTLSALALVALLASASAGATSADDRINLWPLFYSEPPDTMGCFPLFYSSSDGFISLPVCWGPEYASVPLTLSWYSRSCGDTEDYIALLGLAEMRFKHNVYERSWVFPLYYHDEDSFLSPIWASGTDFEAIPFALSWHHSHDFADSYRALLGLGGMERLDGSYASSWLFPLYYDDADTFVSPLVGWSAGAFGIPAALSWYQKRGARESFHALLCLGGLQLEGGAYDRSWLAPLYYHDENLFITPLIGWSRNFGAIPAALSWYRTDGKDVSYWTLLGLGSAWFENGSYDRSWLAPLYYHDDKRFVSPLVSWTRDLLTVPAALYYRDDELLLSPLYCQADDLAVVPLALSWYAKKDARESYTALLGLGGLTRENGKYDRSWLFPLYYHEGDCFLSPLVGWDENFCGIPFALSWSLKNEQRETYLTLMGLGGLRYESGVYDSSWLIPFYYHNTKGTFASLVYAQEANAWYSPALLTGYSVASNDVSNWISIPLLSAMTFQKDKLRNLCLGVGLLYDADYDASGCTSCKALLRLVRYSREKDITKFSALLFSGAEWRNGQYADSYFVPFYSHSADGQFLSIPYSRWKDKSGNTDELYCFLVFRSQGANSSRFSILWKFFDCEQTRGTTSIDAFPGITYDSTPEGTWDFSLWYRFFRCRSTPRGVTNLSLFFIPLK